MLLLVTSASGINGNGYGALLAFKRDGTLIGPFNVDSRIVDPRGLAVDQKEGLLFLNSGSDRELALDPNGAIVRDTGPIAGLNPGGGNFGPDGHYYVGLRSARTVTAFPVLPAATGTHFAPPGIVPFPRGFAFGHDGRLFLASGIGPNGEGDNAIVAITPGEPTRPFRLVSDPDFTPLDLAIAPNGNVTIPTVEWAGAGVLPVTRVERAQVSFGLMRKVRARTGSGPCGRALREN